MRIWLFELPTLTFLLRELGKNILLNDSVPPCVFGEGPFPSKRIVMELKCSPLQTAQNSEGLLVVRLPKHDNIPGREKAADNIGRGECIKEEVDGLESFIFWTLGGVACNACEKLFALLRVCHSLSYPGRTSPRELTRRYS